MVSTPLQLLKRVVWQPWSQVNGRRHGSAQFAKKKKKVIAWAVDPWCSFYHLFFFLSFSLSLCLCFKKVTKVDGSNCFKPFAVGWEQWSCTGAHTCRLSPASSPLTTRSTQARLLWCFFFPPVFCDKHHISLTGWNRQPSFSIMSSKHSAHTGALLCWQSLSLWVLFFSLKQTRHPSTNLFVHMKARAVVHMPGL